LTPSPDNSFNWRDASIGAAVMLGATLLALTVALAIRRHRRRTFLSLGIGVTIGAVALGVAGQALASRTVDVSGVYAVASLGDTSCTSVGSSGFMFRCVTTGLVSEYSGDLTGTAVADFTSLIDCQAGRETGHGTETFTGLLAGVGSGALFWIDQFDSDFDCEFSFPFNLDIDSVAVKGSGDFVGLRGKLGFTDTTYTGRLH
jgi:hypothetical protein